MHGSSRRARVASITASVAHGREWHPAGGAPLREKERKEEMGLEKEKHCVSLPIANGGYRNR